MAKESSNKKTGFISFLSAQGEKIGNQGSDSHRHFKMHGHAGDLFNHPGRTLVVAGVLFLSFASFQVSQLFLTPGTTPELVLGQSVENKQMKKVELVNGYQLTLSLVVEDYLKKRAVFLQELDGEDMDEVVGEWMSELLVFKNKMFGVKVPSQYQDLHLSLVFMLSWEEDMLKQYSSRDVLMLRLRNLSGKWQELLEENVWLNK